MTKNIYPFGPINILLGIKRFNHIGNIPSPIESLMKDSLSSIGLLEKCSLSSFNSIMESSLSSFNLIKDKNDAIIKAAFNMNKVATSIVNSIPSFNYSQGLFSAIGSIMDTHKKFAEQILEEIKEEKDIYSDPKFIEFPFLFAGYLTVPEMRKLKGEWRSGNKNFVIMEVLKTLKFPAIHDEILKNIGKNNILNKRKKLFQEALWAHQQGKYSLSIPLLFPIIEGTLVDKYGWLYKEKRCNKCNRKFWRTASPVLEKVKSKLKESEKKHVFIDQYF